MTAVSEMILRLRSYWRRQGAVDLPAAPMVVSDPVLAPDHLLHTTSSSGAFRCQLVRFTSPATLEGARAARQLARALAFQVTQSVEAGEKPSRPTGSMMESLRAIGLNYETQDLRFRDYRWQNEIFGVEAQGWLMRLNGVDIGRILRLESAAHEALNLPTWSMTYLIGPLCQHMQDVNRIEDLLYEARGESYLDALGVGDRERRRLGLGGSSGEFSSSRNEAGVQAAKAEAWLQELDYALAAGEPHRAYEALLACSLAVEALRLSGRASGSWQERLRGLARRSIMMAKAEAEQAEAAAEGEA